MNLIRNPFTLSLTVALWGSTQVLALPEQREVLIARAVDCKVVTGVLSAVKALGAPATSFCSLYLRIPATTATTVTVMPTTYVQIC
jgi:hypothetical protein